MAYVVAALFGISVGVGLRIDNGFMVAFGLGGLLCGLILILTGHFDPDG